MKIPPPLLDDIAAGKCLPFIGAGFSLNARLSDDRTMPDWPALTEILSNAASVSGSLGGPKVASSYERNFGRVQLIEAIRQALHIDVIEPGVSHRHFAQLPFDTIYTTNFDLLLEEAYALIRKPYRSLVGELQMPFHGGPLTASIVKMHGDLRHEEQIIVTQEDYDKYLDEYPVISTHLSAMLITKTALFIGYSLSDPDFKHIRDVVRSRLGKFQRMSYIIQFNQSKSNIKEMLDDSLHVLNINTKKSESKDEKLSEFFRSIQEELDVRAGEQLRTNKPELFELIPQETIEAATRATDSSALLTSSSNLCFVLTPFGEPFDSVYRELIKPIIIEAGLEPLRADQIYASGTVMEQIRSAIQQSRICIADLTGRNPNVLYELGIAQTLGKPTVLLTQDMKDIPFDVAHFRIIVYRDDKQGIDSARNDLIKAIDTSLGFDRLGEAKQLIENAMFRASVAILGVLLEHSLRHLIVRNKLLDSRVQEHYSRTMTMGKMIDMLTQAKVITKLESKNLRGATNIRNRAVHDLREPTKKDAHQFLDYVESFIHKVFKNA